MNILIAEDDAALRRAYKRMLCDHTIIEAHNATMAIGVLVHDHALNKTPTIDAVISDYNLGHGTGADIWEWVRENRPDLPFVLVTGSAVATDAPILQKPASKGDILRVLGWQR